MTEQEAMEIAEKLLDDEGAMGEWWAGEIGSVTAGDDAETVLVAKAIVKLITDRVINRKDW